MPPTTTPTPTHEEVVEAVFKKSLEAPTSSQPQTPPLSNSWLHETAILSVVQKVDPTFRISVSSLSVTTASFKAVYGIDTTKNSVSNRILLIITQCLSEEEANTAMKENLAGFQGDVTDPKLIWEWKDTLPLGNHALQTPNSVFWVHGTSFLQVTTTAPIALKTDKEVLSKIAKALENHLLQNAVSTVSPPKPQLKTKLPVSVEQGKPFTLELELEKNVTYHPLKPVESSEGGIAICTKYGDANNSYQLFAAKKGKTSISLIVADKNTLMVGSQTVEVTVTESKVTEEQAERDYIADMEKKRGGS